MASKEIELSGVKIQVDGAFFVNWINADLTEGRGRRVPFNICRLRTTAVRTGNGRSVQGMDATVEECPRLRVDGMVYGPVCEVYPSKEDERKEEKMTRVKELIDKALELGLTRDEIREMMS